MNKFQCVCGQQVYFESQYCVSCDSVLAYLPARNTIVSLLPTPDNDFVFTDKATNERLRFCLNKVEYGVCNCVISEDVESGYCILCVSNRNIPDVKKESNLQLWREVENSKRRLYYGLSMLGLQFRLPLFDMVGGKATTGYFNGVVTINVQEADEVQRTWQKTQHQENYRTVLGHLRHEIGHHYCNVLSFDDKKFTELFGNKDVDYGQALKAYYDNGPLPGWPQDFISAYASSHPLEDWAECFAHYLHINDLVETTLAFGLIDSIVDTFEAKLYAARQFGPILNELNRSLGVADAYPFVFTETVTKKLAFIDDCVRQATFA